MATFAKQVNFGFLKNLKKVKEQKMRPNFVLLSQTRLKFYNFEFQDESSWQGWLSAVTLIIYITWGIAGLLAIILLVYMLVDRLEGAEETPDESVLTLKPDPFTVNTLTHDLQQLRNDIDAYIDRSTKLTKR